MYYLEEPGDGGRYEGRRDLGNTEVGDGNLFKGRGMLMITGRANYARFAASIGRPDIMSNPALVATDADIAALVASDYFRRRDLFRFCTATDCDVRSIRRGVNGGLNGLEAVLESYVQVKARLSE